MDADWVTSPSARRVLQHAADSRPAWLWSQDGQELLWQNEAAQLFLAKLKKHGLKLAPPAVPIKGQMARSIRLGAIGRTSLARIQFIAGGKPASSTCATTPLVWQDGQTVLLVVGVDPIAPEILTAAGAGTPLLALAPEESEPVEAPAPVAAPDTPEEPTRAEEDEEAPAPPQDAAEDFARDLANWHEAEADEAPEPAWVTASEPVEEAAEADAEPAPSRLSRLVDRLAADEALFTPLTEADDLPPQAPEAAAPAAPTLFTVTGRGFIAESSEPIPSEPEETEAEADLEDLGRLDAVEEAEPVAEAEAVEAVEPPPPSPPDETPKPVVDAEAVERVSRYNFDELSRILNDRVGDNAAPSAPPSAEPSRGGALINLGGETLVLNRLPLGILVFRDQQVLFANRAITEMVGYDSVESLRSAGLSAVFPAAGPGGDGAGPVNHLVQRDGTLIPVTARLQSISWQGRPALMLSASTTEVRTGHEAAVNAFARSFAEIRGDGFFEASRAGVISAITTRGASLLGAEGMVEGKPLSSLVAPGEVDHLREFLERPARFAESARPCLTLRSASGAAEIIVFAQGQAGVISGYFGFVRARIAAQAQIGGPADADPGLLARISRGVRRPLNTIIGFSDLIRSEAFGVLKNERYESYANDIATAGREIAALVDELDDYARLRDGRYLPQRASIDLTALLEGCVMRIRQQASGARVIVRNAISQNLPRVTADRASLAQAVLNLLASAIDQTPTGGAVVISAQLMESGGIAIHVRDSSTSAVDMAERFVVFRDGTGRDGQMLAPMRSSVGLALTRSLLAVNAVSLSVDPAGEQGMLFSLFIPPEQVEQPGAAETAE